MKEVTVSQIEYTYGKSTALHFIFAGLFTMVSDFQITQFFSTFVQRLNLELLLFLNPWKTKQISMPSYVQFPLMTI